MIELELIMMIMMYQHTLTHFRNNARRRDDAIPDTELTDPHKQQHSGGSKMVYVSNGESSTLQSPQQ